MSDLVVVTATTNPDRARPCVESWGRLPIIGVANGRPASTFGNYTHHERITGLLVPEYLGTVPAFKLGADFALNHTDTSVIACLHDDVEIQDSDWVKKVLTHFKRHPACGLLGFGGAIGLGDADMYDKPYNPMSLARIGFRSNLVDAEIHGMRSLLAEKVACLDGFSQIGRRAFFQGESLSQQRPVGSVVFGSSAQARPWTHLEQIGLRHHIYDGALGCLAKRYGWETWYLPISCKHYGGQTAVGDPGYQEWARTQIEGGDHGFWQQGHRIVWEEFRDLLPLRV